MRDLYDPEIDSTPLPRFVPAHHAERAALRAFWRGALFGAVVAVAAFAASAALADTISISSTTVTIEPAEAPAVARVTMHNRITNGPADTGVYSLAMDGLVVEVAFTWGAGPQGEDRVTVTPPAGYLCQPSDCAMTVAEGDSGVVLLLEWTGA